MFIFHLVSCLIYDLRPFSHILNLYVCQFSRMVILFCISFSDFLYKHQHATFRELVKETRCIWMYVVSSMLNQVEIYNKILKVSQMKCKMDFTFEYWPLLLPSTLWVIRSGWLVFVWRFFRSNRKKIILPIHYINSTRKISSWNCFPKRHSNR